MKNEIAIHRKPFFLTLLIVSFLGCDSTESDYFVPKKLNFNSDWEFFKVDNLQDTIFSNLNKQPREWQKVTIPHTVSLEPKVIEKDQWQGVSWYRKKFTVNDNYKNKHVSLYFEAAMQVAEVWLNNKKLTTHKGGYLPFYIPISSVILFGQENEIVIRLTNKDNSQIPPGKPIKELDFNIYSGIYRSVHLIIKNKLHITHAIESDIIGAGGVFINTISASEKEATISVTSTVLNGTNNAEKVAVRYEIFRKSDTFKIKDFTTKTYRINKQLQFVFSDTLKIENPNLWSPENPALYTIKATVFNTKNRYDYSDETFGIRTIKFTSEGFILNGKKYKIRGTNRHQEYPYLGYAISDNAQYRDAFKIKKAGFNFVRLSHYPHSESFMNACNSLGLLVMDAIPGWQFFGDTVFQENCFSDVRQMIRRDRNHPSVILWEASLNESAMTHTFIDKANAIVHEEFPGNQTYSCGWMEYGYDVFIPARQHAKAPNYWKGYKSRKPLLIAEYGDWEYYAQNAGFNQTSYSNLKANERTSRQLRGDGQVRLAQQALNYQESHNDNLLNTAAGDANWLMFDYNRGYAPDIESSGIMDIFRLPKFSYYFYKSQNDFERDAAELYIANYWNNPKFNTVKVYSNCSEVSLWLNDTLIRTQKPDDNLISKNLTYPPFTFKNIPYSPGTLVAKGYLNGEKVKEFVRKTPKKATKIKLSIDESGIPLQKNNNDVVFVYAKITDSDGTYHPEATDKITFWVSGDATLIGDNPIKAEAGIASVLLKVNPTNKNLKIYASSENLERDSLLIKLD
ncbi:glycoside hydrolase family 2 TIM barrel-domain containing protein [Polaribacter tangerinus]|uniref:glycoside hydrolase family 2 TIM barrel-domain containing protein n=1 Tax=Polaribacter tangerinus TaxID=1920034 RepID=UPI0011814A88|nr:glycoside hydrolase family 2 TIM barrel-domain containing protein [Polaribacter tangerinus]